MVKTSHSAAEDYDYTRKPISCTMPNIFAKVQHLVSEDRFKNIEDHVDEVRIGNGTCKLILTHELGMHCVVVNFISKILSVEHEE